MHISTNFQPRLGSLTATEPAVVGRRVAHDLGGGDAWRTPSVPVFSGGRIVAQHDQTWNNMCAVLVDVRAEAAIQAGLQADFARVCITLEEVGGVFDISGMAGPSRPAATRRAVSVIPPGTRATGRTTTLRFMRQLQLQFDGPTLAEWLEDRVDVGAIFAPRLMVSDSRLLQLGQLIAKECVSVHDGDPLYCDGLAMAVLSALANHSAGSIARGDVCGGLAPWQLRRVTEFLYENLSESVDMAALAGVAGLSKAHFSRAFKVSTGLPPHRWLLNARIARARELLMDSELPLAEISLTVGFADQAHFTRTFGSVVGTSPRAWQRARRR